MILEELTTDEQRITLSALKKQRDHLVNKLQRLKASRPSHDPVKRHVRHNQIENTQSDLRVCVTLIRFLAANIT